MVGNGFWLDNIRRPFSVSLVFLPFSSVFFFRFSLSSHKRRARSSSAIEERCSERGSILQPEEKEQDKNKNALIERHSYSRLMVEKKSCRGRGERMGCAYTCCCFDDELMAMMMVTTVLSLPLSLSDQCQVPSCNVYPSSSSTGNRGNPIFSFVAPLHHIAPNSAQSCEFTCIPLFHPSGGRQNGKNVFSSSASSSPQFSSAFSFCGQRHSPMLIKTQFRSVANASHGHAMYHSVEIVGQYLLNSSFHNLDIVCRLSR